MASSSRNDITADYPERFYEAVGGGSRRAAEVIVPLLMRSYRPSSVVDVGCGTGLWLDEFQRHGVTNILGIDHEAAQRASLRIPAKCFVAHDLAEPFRSPRKFDLVLSLEVAEHLDPGVADQFVQTLTDLGDIVVFSAAIPFQQGVHHVNLRWPSYWARLFASRGYLPSVSIREQIWSLTDLDPWYVQNIVAFESDGTRAGDLPTQPLIWPIDVVHPQTYLGLIDPTRANIRTTVRLLWSLIRRRGRRLVGRT
jgi:SAM-dependent methyltransferase